MKYKIMLSDDHNMVRSGIKKIIEVDEDYKVVAEASSGEETLEKLKQTNVDLLIIDYNMPILNGIETIQKIRETDSELKILVLTMHESEILIMDGFSVGANGFLYKDADMEELLLAIKTLLNGEDYFNEEIKAKLTNFHKTERNTRFIKEYDKTRTPLTKREIEIVSFISKGLNSNEIAQKLFISNYTVIKHRKNILKKLGLKNFAEVVLYLKEKDII